MIDTKMRHFVQPFFDGIALRIAKRGITANQLTVAAFIIGITAGFLISRQYMLAALALLWFSGLLDVLDGSLARQTGTVSRSGALLDLVLDRMVEVAVILGFYLAAPEEALAHLFFLAGVIFNFSTFLAAGALFPNRGEKSMQYDSGLMERTETFLLFSLMLLWPPGRYYVLMAFNGAIFLTGILRLRRIMHWEKATAGRSLK